MPRSFLIKKKDKKLENKKDINELMLKNEQEFPNTRAEKHEVMPLTPLNRAILQDTDMFMNKQSSWEAANLITGHRQFSGFYPHFLPQEKSVYPAITPYAIHPFATDYYKELLPPYSWYLHSLLSQSPPPVTQPANFEKQQQPPEPEEDEDIHIDVEELDDEDACSSTTSMTLVSNRSDEENLHSPIDFSNYHKSISERNNTNSSMSEPMSPVSFTSEDSTSSKKSKGFQDGVTVGYTYEAFFISDGRSRKKGLYTDTKQKYTCSICGKDYATSSNLSRHKQTHRNPESDQAKKCPHCNKVYVSMPALSMHILTHSLKHQCNQCGKSFSRPWLLQGHMRSHTGEKPYGCAHCGKAFADRSNLRAHMQTHSSFKQFKCKRCNKSFALKSYLNKHYESACVRDEEFGCFRDNVNSKNDSSPDNKTYDSTLDNNYKTINDSN